MGIAKNRAKLLYEAQPTVESSGELALEQEVVGIDQTWQNVTGSRSAGVTYTNTTGKPIMVSIRVNNPTGTNTNGGFTITIDGTSYSSTVATSDSGASSASRNTFIVNPGDTYSAVLLGNSGSLQSWHEYRT